MLYKKILEDQMFSHHYQPIYDLRTNRITGYEGLFRSSVTSNLEQIFRMAKNENWLNELDSQSIHKAISTYQDAGYTKKDGKLFINIFPSTLVAPNFPETFYPLIKNTSFANQEIILEIVEHEKVSDLVTFKPAINEMKQIGFSIAIDDFGRGFGDLEKVIELEPDYIKLDRFFSNHLARSNKKQEIIQYCLHYCENYGITLILEGLEDEGAIKVAKSLGVPFGQGYQLGRPAQLNARVGCLTEEQ